jgi:hypothetical protein
MRPLLAAALLAWLAPHAAFAAGPREGLSAAAEAAQARLPGSELVEVEGFTDPEGDIPCSAKALANVWHYKFYSEADAKWLVANSCGDIFMNAAENLPYLKSEEPTVPLPAEFADSTAVLEKLDKAGALQLPGGTSSREILMNVRILPAKDGRPAGCYWTVKAGKQKAFMDCAGKKHWAAPGPKGPALAVKPVTKGKDTAARYTKVLVEAVSRKYPGSVLMGIETLADRTGSAKCLTPGDGWTFIFHTQSGVVTAGGCKGKTVLTGLDFDGKYTVADLDALSENFKDSDFSLSQTPPACVGEHGTISMKLRSFKPKVTPFAGHSLIWTIDCGSLRYYVDGFTGKYLGPGKK